MSSHDQCSDLDRQVARLTWWATSNGHAVGEVVCEVGSGRNGKGPKLRRILSDPSATVVVVEHRDRLARLGVEHLEAALGAPGRGLVLTGPVAASRPAGAGWEADILIPGAQPQGAAVTVRIANPPGRDGSEVTVTAIDPPLFGPDDRALENPSAPGHEGRAHDPAFEHVGEGNGR